jgi:hypothetical protein
MLVLSSVIQFACQTFAQANYIGSAGKKIKAIAIAQALFVSEVG